MNRILFAATLFLLSCQTQPTTNEGEISPLPSEGIWRFSLNLGEEELPFIVQLQDTDSKEPYAILHNATEEIRINDITLSSDSIVLNIPVFNSELAGRIESNHLITGHWINKNKESYKIPFSAEQGKDFRFTPSKFSRKIPLRYKIQFEDENAQWESVLFLKNDQGRLEGTFTTETGDYRYLEGNVMNNAIYLSTFDGSHAFMFKANLQEDSLVDGIFLSGKHYKARWKGKADKTFELRDPKSITYTETNDPISFSLLNELGDTVSWNSSINLGKVTIIDIFGSWCPNCKDASLAIHELTSEYNSDEVQVFNIAFELTEDHKVAKKRVEKMFNDLDLPQKFLFGGYASKQKASEIFPMLNDISSFPTIIFIDKNGKTREIYTGFYGPGTGKYYEDFMRRNKSLIAEMVNN